MTPELQKALDEVSAALAPLPDGYSVEANGGAILVMSANPMPDGLGFSISAKMIAEDRHVEIALGAFSDLVREVEMKMLENGCGNG